MATAPAYTLTQDSIVIVWEGKPRTVQKDSPNYHGLRKAILNEDWADIPNHLTVAKSVQSWAKGLFTVSPNGQKFLYKGEPIPDELNTRIFRMSSAGDDPTPLLNFWERLEKNPSWRSVKQLWGFLQHEHIPLTKRGTFLAYKAVRSDYKDVHSGTYDNSPGMTHEMPRNQISDDPKEACHEGFHVGALGYAQTFHVGGKMIVCEVDPQDVVCVPYDHSQQKMRVCKYKVIGNYGSQLPDDVFEDTIPTDDMVAGASKEYDDGTEDTDPDDVDDIEDEEEKDAATAGSLTRVADALGYDGTKEDGGEADNLKVEKELIKAEKKVADREARKNFAKYSSLKTDGLLKLSIDELRQYATKGLLMVNASKIPGGKVALVSRIIEMRKKGKKEKN